MRAALLLATLLPLAVLLAWFLSRHHFARRQRRRHVEELLRENERLDDLIKRNPFPTISSETDAERRLWEEGYR